MRFLKIFILILIVEMISKLKVGVRGSHGVVIFPKYGNSHFCQTPVLGLGIGVDFTFAGDNDNDKNNHNNHNNPHLYFVKGTALEDKEQGVGMRDEG